jgi:tetratricopeptide (TPR) repeat protein
LFVQCQGYIAKKDHRNAIKVLNQAIDIEPTNPFLITQLGIVYFFNNNCEQGLEYCKKALELDSNQIRALEMLLEFYVEEGEPEKAQVYFDKLKALDSTYINVLLKRGDNLYRNQRSHPAVEVWKRALIYTPGDPEIISRVNVVAEQDFMDNLINKFDNYDQAIEFYKRKSEENPNDEFAKRMIQWVEKRALGLDY